MKTLALSLVLLGSLVIRYVRWLALVQQKEYRLDRIWLFLQSPEGRNELLRVVPKRSDFKWSTLKRPRLTARMLTVFAVSALVIFLYGCAVVWFGLSLVAVWQQLAFFLLSLLVFLCISPLFVMLGVIPSAVIAEIVVHNIARQAQKLLEKHKPVVIGITGSFGKTSTKQLLGYVLGGDAVAFITPESHNTLLSVCKSIVAGYHGQKYVVLEYGAYAPGEIATLARYCPPTMAVITGFAPQHLGLFGSEAAIIEAKSELVSALKPNSSAFYNAVYPQTKKIIEFGSREKKLTITAVDPDKLFSAIEVDGDGYLHCKSIDNTIATKLLGKQYAEICALVMAVAAELGIESSSVAKRLSSFLPTHKFITSRITKAGIRIIDDGGTSNPQGFESALQLIAQLTNTPKILITPGIVDLGTQSNPIHQELGSLASDTVDVVLFVGETGKVAFEKGLGREVISTQENIKKMMSELPIDSLVLVEGRMPGWIGDILKEL